MPDIKQDSETVVKDIGQKLTQEELAARRAAMNELNAEKDYVDKHPLGVTILVVGLVLVLIVMLAKSCS